MNEKENSQITSQLNGRIGTNKKFGSVDLEQWLIEKIAINGNLKILDIGCGTGNHLINIAKKFPNGDYFGIDISKDSINEAKKNSSTLNIKMEFVCGDALDAKELKDGFFDLIISVYALYYIKDSKKILDVMKSKLSKGGKIAIMSPYKRNNEEWYNFLSQFMKIPEKIEWVSNNFMDNEILTYAKENFDNVKTYDFENRILVPSFEDMEKYWKSNVYHKEEYDELFRKNAQEHFKKHGQFVITKRALLAVMF